MVRAEVSPIETSEAGPGGMSTSVLKHPAFASISVSHVSGHANLYGSDFSHQHYVTVTIHTSELRRDLARDWHFDRKELIEVAMSEAQWATFVSTPNRQGPCCTLRSFNGEQTPGLPLRNSTQIFSDEVREKLTSSVERLRQHRADMAAATS